MPALLFFQQAREHNYLYNINISCLQYNEPPQPTDVREDTFLKAICWASPCPSAFFWSSVDSIVCRVDNRRRSAVVHAILSCGVNHVGSTRYFVGTVNPGNLPGLSSTPPPPFFQDRSRPHIIHKLMLSSWSKRLSNNRF